MLDRPNLRNSRNINVAGSRPTIHHHRAVLAVPAGLDRTRARCDPYWCATDRSPAAEVRHALEIEGELPQYRMHGSAGEGVIGRRVYRGQRAARALAWILALAAFLVGVVTATGSPGNPGKGGTAGVVLGVVTGYS